MGCLVGISSGKNLSCVSVCISTENTSTQDKFIKSHIFKEEKVKKKGKCIYVYIRHATLYHVIAFPP